MHVGELTKVGEALRQGGPAWYLSTEPGVTAVGIVDATADLPPGTGLTAFVGPEGGWTDDELRLFEAAAARAVRLTDTILRVETAAVAVAAVVGSVTAAAGRRAAAAPP